MVKNRLHEPRFYCIVNLVGTDYDAFLSYSKHDQPWVDTHLIPRLQNAGIIYLDYQQFQLGALKLNEVERAVISSRKTLMVISLRYLQEDWQGFASVLASSFGLEQGKWPAIPLIIETCELPLRLRALTELDLRQPSEQDWNRLLRELKLETQTPSPHPQSHVSRPLIFYGVPPIPQHFVGRDEIVQNMISRLVRGDSVCLSTDGQGGIGKTTLAVPSPATRTCGRTSRMACCGRGWAKTPMP
ncbi:MAG: hypothetical protein Fur0022_44250 [Anaerolineales bacterium]